MVTPNLGYFPLEQVDALIPIFGFVWVSREVRVEQKETLLDNLFQEFQSSFNQATQKEERGWRCGDGEEGCWTWIEPIQR
jgi:hypothetical protein